MFVTEREIAIILRLPNQQLKPTPAGYSGILVGVCGRIAIVRASGGPEGVG